jgi:hypothetical protein
VYIDSFPSSSPGLFFLLVRSPFGAKTGAVPLQEELHSPYMVKRVLSVSLWPLRIMQWSFHIRRQNYHAQKTLVKRMLRGRDEHASIGAATAHPARNARARDNLGRCSVVFGPEDKEEAQVFLELCGPTKQAAEKVCTRQESNTSGAKALIGVALYGPTKVVP